MEIPEIYQAVITATEFSKMNIRNGRAYIKLTKYLLSDLESINFSETEADDLLRQRNLLVIFYFLFSKLINSSIFDNMNSGDNNEQDSMDFSIIDKKD